ncbi:MAG: winged helix-turn-helix domain-containing protein [Candidatus Nezhaarchaeales archaeon]
MEGTGVLERLKEMRGAQVEVHLVDGRVLRGYLEEVDLDLLNVLLRDAIVEDGRRIPFALVSGDYVAAIYFIGPRLLGDLELKVLSILQQNPSLSVADVAKMVNERPSKIRSVIRKLRRSGFVLPDTSEGRS